MIKTLRITTIIAAVLAGVIFVFPVVFGVRGDGRIEEFLNSVSVIEKFKEAAGTKVGEVEGQSPLVTQAEAFALFLNPPPKPKPVAQMPQAAPAPPRPSAPVSAKFKIISTSFYESRPEQSIALIDEPGKGLHWVRQSVSVGHLVIEQIKDGVVVIRDGQSTSELAVEPRPALTSLLEGSQSAGSPTTTHLTPTTTGIQPALSAAQPTRSVPQPSLPTPVGTAASVVTTQISQAETTAQVQEPEVNSEEAAALEKLVEQLASLQRGPKSDKTGSGTSEEEAAALMEKLMGEFKATRVSEDEAKKLNGLGKELENIQRDPNAPPPPPPPRAPRIEPRSRRPIRPPAR